VVDELNIAQVAEGNHKAFERLFMELFPKVKSFISHVVKSEHVAENLGQDVFLKLWENRAMLPQLQSLNAYVYQMAKNAAFDHLKHCHLASKYAAYVQGVGQESYSPDEALYARELSYLVAHMVAAMPPQRKAVFELSRGQGLRNSEIAARLNLAPKTVENHLNLALRDIRKAIGLMMVFVAM